MGRSTETTTIVLTDKATHCVLTMALWTTMHDPFPKPNDLENLAFESGNPQNDEAGMRSAREQLDERLARASHIRSQIDLVSSAAAGDTVTVEVSPDVVAARLQSQRVDMEENADLFFKASDDRRSRMLVLYDAAGALLEQLPTPAGAVA